MLKYSAKIIAAMLLSMLLVGKSQAAVIYFDPAVQQGMNGDFVSVDLVVSGLGDGVAPSIGAFDLDVGYDLTRLAFSSFSLSSLLGDFLLVEAIDVSLGDLGGTVALGAISFLTPAELDALQGPVVTLASITFEVLDLEVGEFTDVTIQSIIGLGDAFGREITVDGTRVGRIVNGAVVPEPSAAALLLLGVVLLARRMQRG